MMKRAKMALAIAAVAAYAALGWIAGIAVLAFAAVAAYRRYSRTRAAVAPEIACPWCREPVPQYGAYSCASCRARTLGWAWQCSACGAWAGHIECPNCQLSVTNPILGAP